MKKFKVAMVQHRVRRPDPEENTALAVRYMSGAKAAGADLVLFPECFLTGYRFPKICESAQPVAAMEADPEFAQWRGAALSDESSWLERVKQAAKRLSIGAVITCFTQGKKYPRNTAYVIGRDGSVLLKYDKVHTCDFSLERCLESGEGFKVCRFDGVCLGVMICYDREYPESARELMLQGAELILVSNDCDCIQPFRARELSVEAMQNMVGIAMANPPGEAAGCSCAFDPRVWGREENTLVMAGEEFEGLVYAAFDIGAMREYRAAEDLGKFRKVGAYAHLLREGAKPPLPISTDG